jgi:hypothetical protein
MTKPNKSLQWTPTLEGAMKTDQYRRIKLAVLQAA